MKTKRVYRYYCDFCKKSGCNKSAIRKHEKHCTMNPDRECRMCELIGIPQQPIPELIKLVPDVEKLKDLAGNCPACILSAFRQSYKCPSEYGYYYMNEIKEFWKYYNDAKQTEEYYEYIPY